MTMRIVPTVVAILSIVAVQDACAQVGRDRSLWSWTIAAEHHDSIVSVSLDGGLGTGVIVRVDRDKPVKDGFEGYCLTAYHVVESDNKRRAIKVIYRNGRSASRCKVVKTNPELDVALLWVWVPADVTPTAIATRAAKYGDDIEFAGLGGGANIDCCLRSFSARASAPTNLEKIYADVPLLPGDSGGPVFNDHQEVVGVISGGWFWWDGGVLTDTGNAISTTWPARAANLGAFETLVHEVPMIASTK